MLTYIYYEKSQRRVFVENKRQKHFRTMLEAYHIQQTQKQIPKMDAAAFINKHTYTTNAPTLDGFTMYSVIGARKLPIRKSHHCL